MSVKGVEKPGQKEVYQMTKITTSLFGRRGFAFLRAGKTPTCYTITSSAAAYDIENLSYYLVCCDKLVLDNIPIIVVDEVPLYF